MKNEIAEPLLAEILRLARISGAIASGDERKLKSELRAALRAQISIRLLREVILQSYLFAGYAAAINAFIMLNGMAPEDHQYWSEPAKSVSAWRKRGTRLCKIVYGKQYERLVQNMFELHPDLSDWMIVEGYGKVLSRPFLSPRVRELLIVATTAVLRVERQFHSHVKGALHTGSNASELRAVLSSVAPLMPQQSALRFRKLLESLI